MWRRLCSILTNDEYMYNTGMNLNFLPSIVWTKSPLPMDVIYINSTSALSSVSFWQPCIRKSDTQSKRKRIAWKCFSNPYYMAVICTDIVHIRRLYNFFFCWSHRGHDTVGLIVFWYEWWWFWFHSDPFLSTWRLYGSALSGRRYIWMQFLWVFGWWLETSSHIWVKKRVHKRKESMKWV